MIDMCGELSPSRLKLVGVLVVGVGVGVQYVSRRGFPVWARGCFETVSSCAVGRRDFGVGVGGVDDKPISIPTSWVLRYIENKHSTNHNHYKMLAYRGWGLVLRMKTTSAGMTPGSSSPSFG
jgi:hypothetical protein